MSPNEDFDGFLGRAWADHAADPAGVAERLASAGLVLVAAPAQLVALAQIAHHVFGEHLGRWADGRALLQRLADHAACDATGAAAVRRCSASLDLCAGAAGAGAALGPSDRIRVTAMAAANLAERDTPRAAALFRQALAAAEAAQLPAGDAMNRALAVTGNNLACTLEEKPRRSAAERELMIQAAQVGRRYWAVAGGWLETERAEYRLAMTWLQAGDTARARHHAKECLAIVQAHDGPALERFSAWEVLAAVERAAGNLAGLQQGLASAREACATLDEADRGGCQAILDKLAG